MSTYYFVYATWYHEPELRKYLPNAKFVTKATAKNAQLAFVTAGARRDRGWATFDNSRKAWGKDILGLVYEVPDGEGWTDYDDCQIFGVTVYGDNGETYDCWTYRQHTPGIPMRPPKYYFEPTPIGLKAWSFPQQYIDEVMAAYEAATPCPDADRPRPTGAPGASAASR